MSDLYRVNSFAGEAAIAKRGAGLILKLGRARSDPSVGAPNVICVSRHMGVIVMKFSRIAAAAAACISVGFAGGARAAADMVFDFSGVCDNCADYGTGVLTLTSDYQLGDYITTSNFVSFTYSSSDTSYTLTSSDSFFFIGGNVLSTPGQNYVHFRLTSTADQFSSDGSGAWCAGADGCSDTGSSSTWTAAGAAGAPEPAAWALMIAGTWAIGGALRGSRRRLARSA